MFKTEAEAPGRQAWGGNESSKPPKAAEKNIIDRSRSPTHYITGHQIVVSFDTALSGDWNYGTHSKFHHHSPDLLKDDVEELQKDGNILSIDKFSNFESTSMVECSINTLGCIKGSIEVTTLQ